MFHQERDVLAALPERRHAEHDPSEAVVEVLAEGRALDRRLEIPVGRRDDPDVGRMRGPQRHAQVRGPSLDAPAGPTRAGASAATRSSDNPGDSDPCRRVTPRSGSADLSQVARALDRISSVPPALTRGTLPCITCSIIIGAEDGKAKAARSTSRRAPVPPGDRSVVQVDWGSIAFGITARRVRPTQSVAEDMLRIELDRKGKGLAPSPDPRRCLVDDLLEALAGALRHRGAPEPGPFALQHGAHPEAIQRRPGDPRDRRGCPAHAQLRLKETAAPATINRELAALRAAYRLGLDNDVITAMPRIKLLPENNVRKGFAEAKQLETVCKRLKPDVADGASLRVSPPAGGGPRCSRSRGPRSIGPVALSGSSRARPRTRRAAPFRSRRRSACLLERRQDISAPLRARPGAHHPTGLSSERSVGFNHSGAPGRRPARRRGSPVWSFTTSAVAP